MPTIVEALGAALTHQQARRWPEAQAIYQHILSFDASNADALHLSGLLAHETGNQDTALQLVLRAVAVRSDIAPFHNSLGMILHATGRLEEAQREFEAALRLDPGLAPAHVNLGNLLQDLGQPEGALAHYEEALRFLPDTPEIYNNMGNAHLALRAPEQAEKLFREALRRNSDYTEALVNLSGALQKQGRLEEAEQCGREAIRRRPDLPEGHANLAAVLIELDRLPEAERCCREALRLRPGFAAAWCNLGDIAGRQERFVESEACCREALRGLPGHAESWLNLGNALKRQNRPDEAIACYHAALRSRPDYAEAHTGLGACHYDLGRFQVASECCENALRIDPGQVEAHWNRSLLWLLEGRYEEGWPEYEWRRKRKGGERFPHSSWDGSPLDGRTLLVHAEQGLGDTLQFARYLPLVDQAGGRVLFECQPLLAPLLRGIAHGSPLPDWDVQVPLMSLAGIFGMLPAPKPYVRVEPELVSRWALRIPPNGGLRVGVVWAGNPRNTWDFARSLPADLLRPLAGIPGVTFYSLQQKATPTPDWIQTTDEPGHEITDRAAAILNLDLVISVDTMIAHLAGALGAPVWVLLPHVPGDWRWQLNREDSPWYPSARLFRQHTPGGWVGVIARVQTALARESRKSSYDC